MTTSEGYYEARQWLKEQWTRDDGRIVCPECGCPAFDWRRTYDSISMLCEDCGTTNTRRFRKHDPIGR